jgi:hypothetical protein
MTRWRKFVYGKTAGAARPECIKNAPLLCQHRMLQYAIDLENTVTNTHFDLVQESDWLIFKKL